MDAQTQWILVGIGGVVLLFFVFMAWYYNRQVNKLAHRKYGAGAFPQKPAKESGCNCGGGRNCECPPHESRRCVPARVSRPDPTPVAIFGVCPDDPCSRGSSKRPTQSQMQALADRWNEIADEDESDEIDELLARLMAKKNKTVKQSP